MKMKVNEIESAIKDLISEVKEALNMKENIDTDFCPGKMIKSDALITVIGRLSAKLGVEIPLNCYPFFDKKNHKQLSIKEAAGIVHNLVHDGK